MNFKNHQQGATTMDEKTINGVQQLLTKAQVAEVLQVSVRTIELWIRDGRLRATRLGPPPARRQVRRKGRWVTISLGGGSVRIAPQDLEAFIAAGMQ